MLHGLYSHQYIFPVLHSLSIDEFKLICKTNTISVYYGLQAKIVVKPTPKLKPTQVRNKFQEVGKYLGKKKKQENAPEIPTRNIKEYFKSQPFKSAEKSDEKISPKATTSKDPTPACSNTSKSNATNQSSHKLDLPQKELNFREKLNIFENKNIQRTNTF